MVSDGSFGSPTRSLFVDVLAQNWYFVETGVAASLRFYSSESRRSHSLGIWYDVRKALWPRLKCFGCGMIHSSATLRCTHTGHRLVSLRECKIYECKVIVRTTPLYPMLAASHVD